MSVGAALRIELMQRRIKFAPDKFIVETSRLPLEFSTFAFPHEKQRRTSNSLVVDNLCLFENFIDRRAEVARAELPSVFFQIDIGGFIDVPR